MSAKAEIFYYCDRCGRGCCDDHEVICGKCADEERKDYEERINRLEDTIRELRMSVSRIQRQRA